VYLGMECRRAVGLFLPCVKKKIDTYTYTQRENEIERCDGEERGGEREKDSEREVGVSLATGNFLLEPE